MPNPKNWRKHPEAQSNAMRGVLAEVGIAGALLAYETPSGLMLIDGHDRAELDVQQEWPVLILDVTPAEADYLLATHDSIGAMAETDTQTLQDLIEGLDIESDAVQAMLDALCAGEEPKDTVESEEQEILSQFLVVIESENEKKQLEVLEKCLNLGLKCKALTS
jgi:hypothetical protein